MSHCAQPSPAAENSFESLLAEEAHLSRLIRDSQTGDDMADPVTVDVYLRVFAVRTAISHTLAQGCQGDVRDAIEAGATWREIAFARAVTVDQARAEFRRWAQAQGALWDSGVDAQGQRHGLNPRAQRAVIALADPRPER